MRKYIYIGCGSFIEAIDTAEQIERVLPILSGMVNVGMIMVADVNVIKYGKE